MRKTSLILCTLLLFFIVSQGGSSADPIVFEDSIDTNFTAPFDDFGRITSFPGIGKHYPMSFGDTYGAPIDETDLKNADALKNEVKAQGGYADANVATFSSATVSPEPSVVRGKKESAPGKSKPVSMEPRKATIATGKDAGQSSGRAHSFKGVYVIQVGAFGKRENAEQFRKLLQSKYPDVITSIWENDADHLYRVHLGSFPTESEAHRYREILKGDNRPGVVVRKE